MQLPGLVNRQQTANNFEAVYFTAWLQQVLIKVSNWQCKHKKANPGEQHDSASYKLLT